MVGLFLHLFFHKIKQMKASSFKCGDPIHDGPGFYFTEVFTTEILTTYHQSAVERVHVTATVNCFECLKDCYSGDLYFWN